MTSPIAIIGLTYATVDLQPADLQWLLQITRGIIDVPTVRGKDTIIPGLAGRLEQNRKNDVLSIVLKGWVRGDPAETDPAARHASFRTNTSTIRTLFRPDRERAPLVATLEDGTSQVIDARPLNIVPGYIVPGEIREFDVELEGYDDWQLGS